VAYPSVAIKVSRTSRITRSILTGIWLVIVSLQVYVSALLLECTVRTTIRLYLSLRLSNEPPQSRISTGARPQNGQRALVRPPTVLAIPAMSAKHSTGQKTTGTTTRTQSEHSEFVANIALPNTEAIHTRAVTEAALKL
jgi:hypothetical protein